jgi:hypothetical protein
MASGPRPGTMGLTPIAGEVGRLIRLGQKLNGNGFSTWEHAFILLPGNQILEAEPGGARIVPLHYDDVYWCQGICQAYLPPVTNDVIMEVARSFEGVGYSFLDYAALTGHRLHIPDAAVWPNRPGSDYPRQSRLTLQQFISDSGHQICSQMDDTFYLRLGAHVFNDGRWPGYVTPGALWKRDLELAR